MSSFEKNFLKKKNSFQEDEILKHFNVKLKIKKVRQFVIDLLIIINSKCFKKKKDLQFLNESIKEILDLDIFWEGELFFSSVNNVNHKFSMSKIIYISFSKMNPWILYSFK